jgi:ribonuclease T2
MFTTRPAGRFARFRGSLLPLLGFVAVAAAWPHAGQADDFDFYVLSLSWSPSYCAAAGHKADPAECSKPRAFVVHGLWPQYERGYPEFCARGEPGPPKSATDAISDIMPGAGLVRYQWTKHGSCTGLAAEAYLATLRRAHERITIPDSFASSAEERSMSVAAVEAAFVQANPGMRSEGIAVRCKGSLLREVRICLTRDLEFRACEEVDRGGCRRSKITMPAAGGQ